MAQRELKRESERERKRGERSCKDQLKWTETRRAELS